MTPKERLTGLLEYVEELARLPERAVFSVRSYQALCYFEHQLRGRVGIQHDIADKDEVVWLQIDRLQRENPPAPDDSVRPWITVSRDPHRHPEVREAIIETMSRADAEDLVSQGVVDQADVMDSPHGGDDTVDVRLLLDRQPAVQEAIQSYVKGPWQQWVIAERPRRETIAIYDKFFSIVQAIETAGADNPTEVVVGVGMALLKIGARTITHPLVEALVEVGIDPRTHAIQVRARDTEPQLYLKPFIELDNPAVPALRKKALAHIDRMSSGDGSTDKATTSEFSPFDQHSFEPILRDAVTLLSPEARYHPDVTHDPDDRTLPDITEQLTITDTWAIYARPRSGNLFVQDIERLKQAIDSSPEDAVPGPCKRLVSDPADEPEPEHCPDIGRGIGISPGQGVLSTTRSLDNAECDVLFPKPYNDAQIEIIRRLENEDGIVVQGPPGTGKTHTIANIICHYLATGRNVLVVSKGEPALEVLRNQIPEEVRNLTISLLTSERQGLKQLEAAVTFMANRVVNKNPTTLDARRCELEQEIVRLREDIARLDAAVSRLAERQLSTIPQKLCSGSKSWPAEVAQLVTGDRERHQWLEDALGPSDEYDATFTDQEINEIRSARRQLGEDLGYLGCKVPSPNDLPDATTLCSIHEDLVRAATLRRMAEEKDIPAMSTRCENAASRAEQVCADLRLLAGHLSRLKETPWLRPLYDKWLAVGVDGDGTQLINELISLLGRAVSTRHGFLQRPVALPNLAVQREVVIGAAQRAKRGERPFPLLSFGNREAKAYIERIQVSGQKPRTIADWDHVCKYFDYQDVLSSLVARWNAIAVDLGLPPASRDHAAADRWVPETHDLLQAACEAATVYRQRIQPEITALFPSGIDVARLPRDPETLQSALSTVEMNLASLRLSAARETIVMLSERLATCSGPITSKLRAFLCDAVGDVSHNTNWIGDQWRDLLQELKRIRNLRGSFDTVERGARLVRSSGAPQWAEKLRTIPAETQHDPLTPSNWSESWTFRRLESYLRQLDAREELKQLSTQHSHCSQRLARALAEVVQVRTYIGLYHRMRAGGRLSALMQFMHAIRQIGAGTGIRARRYRGDARTAMLKCMNSVPCWITPTWRVSESLPAQLGSFDLLIVDEASQSDVLALPVLLRAKKVLVVGDDRQVSPSPVGLEERKLLQLRHSYLQGQPFADMVMPGTSLYDLAQAVFPSGRILLNEHFRCVEPIIRFSLQFYPEEIVPLRIPKPSERLDPPLIDVYVENAFRDGNKVNEGEAVAIVDEIERLTKDPAYKERTFGVVSLIGNRQAQVIQMLLIERIGEDAFLRHRIACGDSATFQGKERDVMFVSMVASPGKAHAQISRLFEQRFNVALSRARDRMYLFRSVRPEDLSNPKDLKLRVVNHFQNPMPVPPTECEELADLCESQFERDVLRRLIALGYRVTPQVAVGEYRIDLVVDGENDRRLAVELDGDQFHGPDRWFEDWRRQKTMERMGWRFWRCWASSYYMDPEGCIAELTDTLREMKISPIGQSTVRHPYTEHRTVSAEQPSAGDSPLLGRDLRETVAEAGDRVIISFDEDASRHYMLTLSDGTEDLPNGIVSVLSPTGTALLGTRVEDEVDLVWKGENRHAVVLEIERPSIPGVEVANANGVLLDGHGKEREASGPKLRAHSRRGERETAESAETEPESRENRAPTTSSRNQQRSRNDRRGRRPAAAASQPPQSLLFPTQATSDENGTSALEATETELTKYREYRQGMEDAGLPPRSLSAWLERYRQSQKRS